MQVRYQAALRPDPDKPEGRKESIPSVPLAASGTPAAPSLGPGGKLSLVVEPFGSAEPPLPREPCRHGLQARWGTAEVLVVRRDARLFLMRAIQIGRAMVQPAAFSVRSLWTGSTAVAGCSSPGRTRKMRDSSLRSSPSLSF